MPGARSSGVILRDDDGNHADVEGDTVCTIRLDVHVGAVPGQMRHRQNCHERFNREPTARSTMIDR